MKPSEKINCDHKMTETTVEILLDEGFIEAPVKVSLELSPRPQVILAYELPSNAYAASNEINETGEVKVRLDDGVTLETIVGDRWHLGGGKVSNILIPKSEPVTVRGDNQFLSECGFSLINFPSMWGDMDIKVPSSSGGSSSGTVTQRIQLNAHPWSIEIVADDSLMSMHYSLTRRGGSAITHKGVIKRTDGLKYKADDVLPLVNALHLFLSFARGSYCGITLLKGFEANPDKDCVWEQWGTYKVEPWRRELQSWADGLHSHTLSPVFEGFWNLLNDPSHSDTVSQVIKWYLRSNESVEPEVSMVLTQAALERLANNTIGSKKKVSENDGGEEYTRDWIKRALEKMGIGVALPAECVELRKLSNARNWLHGPQALVSIRNKLVHPNKTDNAVSESAWLEARALGLHYVELMLLKLTGHNGDYLNRSKHQHHYHLQIETVPWAVAGKT